MRCEHCGDRDAVIKLTQVEQDTKITLHLCESCATEKGVEVSGPMPKSPLGDFLATLGQSEAEASLETSAAHCEFCHGTLQDFRHGGRLGCPHCYVSFERHLRDLLRQLHGSSQHVGEAYLSPGEAAGDPARVLADLREQLRRAVDGENFELAAELRDRIRGLECST